MVIRNDLGSLWIAQGKFIQAELALERALDIGKDIADP